MAKIVLTRTIGHSAIVAAFVLLAACAPVPVQPIPPGPTPGEVADYATAQMHYRLGLATGNDDTVEKANKTFRQIPREIFFRQDPRLFEAEVVCERYKVPGPAIIGLTTPTPYEPQCQNIGWRYNEATIAIRQDLEARINAAALATIAQAGPAHP